MYMVIDTETNGLPKTMQDKPEDFPRLVQICYQIFNESHELLKTVNCIIKPEGFIIPPEITKIHGISQEKALKEGYPLKIVISHLLATLRLCQCDMVAHNIEFDYKVILGEVRRCGLDDGDLIQSKKICTKLMGQLELSKCLGDNVKYPRLIELHTFLFNKEFTGQHDALHDVEACARCYRELKRRESL